MSFEDWFSDPVNRARFLRWAWIISLVMLVFGYIMIAVFWNK